MIRASILVMSLFYSLIAFGADHSGHETGNGGDVHFSRYLSAKQFAEVIMKNVTAAKLKEIFPNTDLYNIVNDNISAWPKTIASLEFVSTDKMLFEDGREKAAISMVNSNQVKISKAYFEKYNLSLEEVIVNVIHESGHKLGITDHNKLDKIGSIFVSKIYKNIAQNDSWLQYLKMDEDVQNRFDSRLKNVALEYLAKGDGVKLGKFLFVFSNYELQNSNLAQLFRYMGFISLKLDIRKVDSAYWELRGNVVNRFIRELTLFSRTLPQAKCNQLVKYGMAKLKVSGSLYTENMYNFNTLADSLTQILLDRTVSIDTTVENFKEKIKSNFFIYI